MKSSGEESCRVKKRAKKERLLYMEKQTGIKKMSCGKKNAEGAAAEAFPIKKRLISRKRR